MRAFVLVAFICVGPAAAERNQPAATGASLKTWQSGVSCADRQHPTSFDAWRGQAIQVIGIWADKDDGNQRHLYALESLDSWAGALDIATGMLVKEAKEPETFAAAARGAYDDRWRAAMATLHRHWGQKTTVYIRPAHEMNGSWYPWSVRRAQAEDFKAAWRRYHAIVQSELVAKGRDARMVFSPNWDSHSDAHIDDIYPGNAYVDVIGVDVYDNHPSTPDEASWKAKTQATKAGSPRGLATWQAWALAKGKPLSFPEWGLNHEKTNDNAFFIRQMHRFFQENAGRGPGQVVYEIYFNCFDTTRLHPSSAVPRSAQMYRSLYGRPASR